MRAHVLIGGFTEATGTVWEAWGECEKKDKAGAAMMQMPGAAVRYSYRTVPVTYDDLY